MRSIAILLGIAALLMATPAIAATIYSNNFTSMTDITAVLDTPGAGEVGVGPAPGGLPGNALYNKKLAAGDGYSLAYITPSGATFPNSGQMTIVYRLYIETPGGWGYSGYSYPDNGSAEGPALWTSGNLVHTTSTSANILVPAFKANTWYTIAEVGSPGAGRPTHEDVYVAEGAVNITAADLKLANLVWWYNGTGDHFHHTIIFNPLGAAHGSAGIYIADYTINEGADFTIIPEPAGLVLLAVGSIVMFYRR